MNAPEKMPAMNLYQRINAVRIAVKYVQKDKSVSTGGGSYRAVTHDMVTAMIRSHLIENGIICIPSLVTSSLSDPAEGSKQWRYAATYDFTFLNIDNPEDKLVIRIEAHAMDNADKAPGKAISYAKKYAVLKLFEIETGEDEESRIPEDFPTETYIKEIEAATDMDALKKAYAKGYSAAVDVKNIVAQRTIIAAKDAKKKTLEVSA